MAAAEPANPTPRRSIDDHPLVRAVLAGDEGVDLLKLIQQQMAHAAAELGFLDHHRDEFEPEDLLRRGRDITRQVRALRRFADLEVARLRHFGPPAMKLDDPMIRRTLDLLVERIVQVAYDVLPETKADELDVRLKEAVAADPQLPWA